MSSPPVSYYRASVENRAPRPAPVGRGDARVCVVGGGVAGLNTALGLAERGVRDVVLLEAQEIGHGASGRNGGFVFGGFSRGEGALLRDLGPDAARALYRGTLDAVELIRARTDRYAIDCERTDAGVIWANWFRDPDLLRARQRLLAESFGVHWEWMPQARVRELLRTDRYSDALFEPQAFHFHPLKYAQGLAAAAEAQGVRVHEQAPVVALERRGAGWRVGTRDAQVDAEEVVLACGGYLADLRREVDAAVLPIATYVMVTEPLGDRMHAAMRTRAAVYDTRFAFDYYRPLPDTRLLWGGRISILNRDPAGVERLLRRDLHRVFPQLDGVRVDFAWSGLMSYARHEMPQVGRIDDGLWLAQAFGGHGVAPTTFGGELVASGIATGDVRWRELTRYGLEPTYKPFGFLGAQASYWSAIFRDAWKDATERRVPLQAP
jgi:gamma-glutamylputrescine oxidase